MRPASDIVIPTASDFIEPWRDLRNRLEAASMQLKALATDTNDDNSGLRLRWKRQGIEAAIDIRERINDSFTHNEINAEVAWRTFTAQVDHLFTVPHVHEGFYEGVALSLTYQRGYGPGIDAPMIPNPHLAQK